MKTDWIAEFKSLESVLNVRERTVIRERRLNAKTTTREALAKRFGITPARVRQIESGALAKLRQAMIDQGKLDQLQAALEAEGAS